MAFKQFEIALEANGSGVVAAQTDEIRGVIERLVWKPGDMGASTTFALTGAVSGVPIAAGAPGGTVDVEITPEGEGRTATDLSSGAGTATKKRIAVAEPIAIAATGAANNSSGSLVFVIRTDAARAED